MALYLRAIDKLDGRARADRILDINLGFGGDEQSIRKALKALSDG